MAEQTTGKLTERPEPIPAAVWEWMPALPFEYPGICSILPLPRILLDKLCPPVSGARFRVSELVISPTEVNPGQPVSISVLVTNIGSEAGTKTITLGGDFMAEQVVSLEPGESTTVSFDVIPDVARSYSITVNGLHGSFRATTVPVADIRIENLVIEPPEVMVGEAVTISVVATNYGGASGSKTINCTVS